MSEHSDANITSPAAFVPPPDNPGAGSRYARTRKLKRVLRFVPRRAVFHRYPLIGRFAATARRRAYLWSFKPAPMRRAIYIGAILSLWPVMGLQLALAFFACAVLRGNVMVAGALQFVTNPLTAAPVYYLTYRIGKYVLAATGLLPSTGALETPPENVLLAVSGDPDLSASFLRMTAALFVGGTLCGLALALVLDLLYVLSTRTRAARA